MIDLQADALACVIRLLQQHVPQAEVWAFGSRVQGTAMPYSDLDLAVVGAEKLPKQSLYQLQEAFQESDLPFRVDVLDWHRITPEFRQHIRQQHEVIYSPPEASSARPPKPD